MMDIPSFISQVSSVIASGLGLVLLVRILEDDYLAFKRLSPGPLRTTLLVSTLFIFSALGGIIFMTVYHLAENIAPNVSEAVEAAWYVFMFIGLFTSVLESLQIIELGKYYASLGKKLSTFMRRF
ncbi:hypothetical protein HY489_03505 [Candidatus Woesearchaeota archaeon]|nr:hypothetical protein [Candidatus Woesearchaeota archaeon]